MGVGHGQHEGSPAPLLTDDAGRDGVEFHEGHRASGVPCGIADRSMLRTQRREVDTATAAAFKCLREFPGRMVNTLEGIVRGREHIAVQGGDVVGVADRMQNSPSRHHAEVRKQPEKCCFPLSMLLRRFDCRNALGDPLPHLAWQMLQDHSIRVT